MATDQSGKVDIVNIIVILLLIVACGIWFVFLRPVTIQKATGTVTDKFFKPAGEYTQYPGGTNRGFTLPNTIPIAESYIFRIQIDGSEKDVGYALNTVASREFEVGNRVQIEIERRGLPILWSRLYVLDMHAIK